MMIQEFEQRTGLYPSSATYAAIERAYMEFDGDKDAFCKAYKANKNHLAERIQNDVNLEQIKASSAHEKAIREAEKTISSYAAQIEELKKQLDAMRVSHELFRDLYMLIDGQIEQAKGRREAATDTLAQDIDPHSATALDALQDLRNATKRLSYLEALMGRFETEIKDPEK